MVRILETSPRKNDDLMKPNHVRNTEESYSVKPYTTSPFPPSPSTSHSTSATPPHYTFPQKRYRKSRSQLSMLREAFSKNPNWTKSDIAHIATVTNLTVPQVYKWLWDQKQKTHSFRKKLFSDVDFYCSEFLRTDELENSVFAIRKAYCLQMQSFEHRKRVI